MQNPKALLSLIVPSLVFLLSCKSSQPASSGFQDDMSVFLPDFADTMVVFVDAFTPEENQSQTLRPVGYINEELNLKLDAIAQNANPKVKWMEGFRVQVYSGASREDALKTKSELTEKFPHLKIDYIYSQPNHKVMLGHYLNKADAHQIYSQLKDTYPASIIVPGLIPFNKEDFIKK